MNRHVKQLDALLAALRLYADPNNWDAERFPRTDDDGHWEVNIFFGHEDDDDPWTRAATAIAAVEGNTTNTTDITRGIQQRRDTSGVPWVDGEGDTVRGET